MIPQAEILAWRVDNPWSTNAQVEQDLLICRTLVALFSDPVIAATSAFRGGTALHKLLFAPAARYSEDIDLVQIREEPIGDVVDAIHRSVDPFLGRPVWKQKEGRFVLYYKVESEGPPAIPLRIKVEINTREHFHVFDLVKRDFRVESGWFSGACKVVTYDVNELMGTKMRALYQRRKGRDLFDLWTALQSRRVAPERIVQAFNRYMKAEGHRVTQKEFRGNLRRKMSQAAFRSDIEGLLRPDVVYDPDEAFQVVEDKLISRI